MGCISKNCVLFSRSYSCSVLKFNFWKVCAMWFFFASKFCFIDSIGADIVITVSHFLPRVIGIHSIFFFSFFFFTLTQTCIRSVSGYFNTYSLLFIMIRNICETYMCWMIYRVFWRRSHVSLSLYFMYCSLFYNAFTSYKHKIKWNFAPSTHLV